MKKNVIALAALALLGGSAAAAHAGSLTWSGRVDNVTVVRLHGRNVRTEVLQGKGVQNERYYLTGRFHPGVSRVRLEDARGRGQIQLIRRPGRFEGNTVTVRISDPQPGNGLYHFRLTW